MRVTGAVIFACGCNQVFGLTQTEPIDAAYYDAAPHAPYMCPAIGQPPQFTRSVLQATIQHCETSYRPSPIDAIAMCVIDGTNRIAQGPVNQPLVAAVLPSDPSFTDPRLSADGNELFLAHVVAAQPRDHRSFSRFRRTPSGWAYVDELPITVVGGDYDQITTATTDGHILVRRTASGTVEERNIMTGALIRSFSGTQLGVSVTGPPAITSDGLRIVFTSAIGFGVRIAYADRPSTDQQFGTAMLLDTPDSSEVSFIADDCSTLYFHALGYALYVMQ